MKQVRKLQKIIFEYGILSRRKADLLIKKVKVTLNGREALMGEKADPQSDQVLVDKKDLPKKGNHKVFLLNKPHGIISTCQDNHGRKTILSLIPFDLRHGFHPIGRLDSDSRGGSLWGHPVQDLERIGISNIKQNGFHS